MPTPPLPADARGLLAMLGPHNPAVEGRVLALAAALPPAAARLLAVLHTGVRALLAGRIWYGCDGDTGRVHALDPSAPIPWGVSLLCVEGDDRWDRIARAARDELPRLFAPPPPWVRPKPALSPPASGTVGVNHRWFRMPQLRW